MIAFHPTSSSLKSPEHPLQSSGSNSPLTDKEPERGEYRAGGVRTMSTTTLKRRAQVLAAILILAVLLTATTAFAATRFIKAKRGGTIRMDRGVWLVIRPGALEEDAVISADMYMTEDSISFEFGPSGTEFDRPAELRVTWQAIGGRDVEDVALYGEDGEEIEEEPEIRRWGVVWYIEHFSLYYYRRR
jgi:hypothetical protein